MTQVPLVAIVGRPNVGKSTLFNRISQERIAIVEPTPGVTRDRLYHECEWRSRRFMLVDTGGIEVDASDTIGVQMRRQASLAVDEADLILFVVDAQKGVIPADEEVTELLRRSGKPVLLVANKAEGRMGEETAADFYTLGLGKAHLISAHHGIGVGDLLDEVLKMLPAKQDDPYDETTVRISVVGKPNVGKSSMVNAILGEERVITSNIPGTTRDAIDTPFTRNERTFVIIDTAGIRRRANVEEAIERYSVMRALRAIERSDVVLVVIDATQDISEQDRKVAALGHEAGKGTIIVINKWDAVEKDENTMVAFERRIRAELDYLAYAPIIFVSAKTGKRIPQLMELVEFVAEQHAFRVPTSSLNDVIKDALARHEPPTDKGRPLKISYVTQAAVRPPTFIFFVNNPDLMHFSYQRYLENRLREAYGFQGTPLFIKLRAKER